jgi:hypothetical protein
VCIASTVVARLRPTPSSSVGDNPAEPCGRAGLQGTPDYEEDTVAKQEQPGRIDPSWPDAPDGEHHPVSELKSHTQGPLSPFGEDVEFPLPHVPYVHPHTEINRTPPRSH